MWKFVSTPTSFRVWYAQGQVDTLPRLRGSRKHRIQYRHIIDWLIRKPGAFENYRYREELFPTTRFRMAYDQLRQHFTSSRASKDYLQISAVCGVPERIDCEHGLGSASPIG